MQKQPRTWRSIKRSIPRHVLLVFAVVLFAVCVNGNFLLNVIDDDSVEIILLNESQYCFVNQNTIRVSNNFTSELQDIVNKTEHVIIRPHQVKP